VKHEEAELAQHGEIVIHGGDDPGPDEDDNEDEEDGTADGD
jgi:hypothetical protein